MGPEWNRHSECAEWVKGSLIFSVAGMFLSPSLWGGLHFSVCITGIIMLPQGLCKGKLADLIYTEHRDWCIVGSQWLFAYILLSKGLWNLGNILEPDNVKTVPPKAYTGPQAKVCQRCWGNFDQVSKIVLWEGLHAPPPASQALCHTNQPASLGKAEASCALAPGHFYILQTWSMHCQCSDQWASPSLSFIYQ